VRAFPSQQDVDKGKGDGQIELEDGDGAGGGEIAGRKVGLLRDALQELAKGEVLGGDQTDAKSDAQISANGVARLRAKASWS